LKDDLRDGRWCEGNNINEYLFPTKVKKEPATPAPPKPEIRIETVYKTEVKVVDNPEIVKKLSASLAKCESYDLRITTLQHELSEAKSLSKS